MSDDYSDTFSWMFACYGPPKNPKVEKKKQKLEKIQEKPNQPNMKPWANKPQKPDKPKPGSDRASQDDLKSVIHVVSVDLNIPHNTVKHHTDQYECTTDDNPELIVRRGKYFKLSVTFDRQYNIENDDLKLVFKTDGKRSDATFGSFMLDESGKKRKKVPKEWEARLLKKEGKTLHMKVHTPVNCAIGEFSFNVFTHTQDKDKKVKKLMYEHPDDITVLFNPWCEHDETYFPVQEELNEYVLNDHGAIYRGSAYWPQGKDWNFGQFENGVLDAALFLVKKCFKKKNLYKMADPVLVARKIAAVVNCNDSDNGVLWGNWSGNYDDGTSPLDWYGSPRILRQYMEQEQPVKYGQCWVFSGVTTTVCRALGLPARSVTNFGSAHDTDGSCTIDKFFQRDSEGVLVADDSSDSIWNYHVWNEVWMKRNDIPWKEEERVKFDGWQAIDATPQEESGGIMTCGPCPVYAIKHGMVTVPYDCAFIFSEVNADEVHWEILPDGQARAFDFKQNKVGKSISTKKPDGKPFDKSQWFDKSRYDVTNDCYKFPEGSKENREAVMRAALGAKRNRGAYDNQGAQCDVKFTLEHAADIYLGQDIKVQLKVQNQSEYTRDIGSATFRFLTQTYTGVVCNPPFKKIKTDGDKQVAPNKDFVFEVVLKPTDYLPYIDDDRHMCIQAFAMVKASNSRPEQNCVKDHVVQLAAPILEVSMPAKAKKGTDFQAVITFTNPFTYPLTDCKAGFEGKGFANVTGEKQTGVPGNGKFEGKFKLKGRKTGTFTLTFKFTSKQLKHLSTSAMVIIE